MSSTAYHTPIPTATAQVNDEFMDKLHKRSSASTLEQQKELYVESLSPKERKAYNIAKDHLGMSFTLEKSVGFLEWKRSRALM